MLLRSVTQHIKDQNWFAVFVDFIIVVVGVFMGIQVQEWNENLNDKADGREYLERLVTDMELSIARNDIQINLSRAHIASYDMILDALKTCRLTPVQEPVFASGLYNLGKFDMPILIMGTINELNATGHFPLIGGIDLRRQISETLREQQTVLAIDNQITARVVPSVNYVRSLVSFDLDNHLTAATEIDPNRVSYDFDELCADDKFFNAISGVREMTLATIAFTEGRRNDQANLVEALRHELGDVENN
jgi:hypothetical protein